MMVQTLLSGLASVTEDIILVKFSELSQGQMERDSISHSDGNT